MSSTSRLLLYGRSGEFRLEASYTRAFRQLGWTVERFDAPATGDDLSWWITSSVARRITRRSLFLRRVGAGRRNERLVRRTREIQPELVLLVNGALVMPEAVASMQEAGATVAVFHPDAPVPGNPNYRPEHLPVARQADACFVWSRELATRLRNAGVSNTEYLPFAWDPRVFPHVEEAAASGPEVIFVGGWDEHRERWLEPVADVFDLEIWGPDYWERRTRSGSPVHDCWQGRGLRGREAAEAVANAKVALNVLRRQNLPDGTNMRTFEVPGAGGFLLATRSDGAAEIYPEEEAGAYFESPDELLSMVRWYLDHTEERQAIAERAHAITAAEHRYVDRARTIVQRCQS